MGTAPAPAHVLVFPWPIQGHLNVMLHLAVALAGAGVHVTFLHTDYNLRRLGAAAAAAAVASPWLRFMSVPDGLPDDHPRTVADLGEISRSLHTAGRAAYRVLLASSSQLVPADAAGGGAFPPVTTVVADALLPFATDVAEEIGVPALAFRTASACSFLAYMSVPRLVELGELPFPPGGDLDEPVRGVPGMEGFLRRRDLPSPCRHHGANNDDAAGLLGRLVEAAVHSGKARALILNTAASLEAPALAHISPRMRDVFAVGPLHAMSPAPAAATSLWRADDGCVAWLDGQADRLVELGELPFPPGGDLDEPVRGVPGMEGFLRRRDLPSPCRHHGANNDDAAGLLGRLVEAAVHSGKARALILNTAASLEAPALAHISPRMRDVFAVGPLHAMSPAPAAATSLWRADDGCVAWLDGQADRSVVYVSLGSLTVITPEQFTEFLSGLVAAGYPFLWVLRPDMVGASQHADLQEAVTAAAGDSKARVVGWAPQPDVLRHRAVGCFLTHAGWNSTLEAAVEGVPTVCWPFFTDQQINSRFVGGVWRTGLDMKDVCDVAVVARMVTEAMESGEIRALAQTVARQLRRDVAEGGSSATELKRLIGFIGELATPIQHAESEV
uniref:Uncharacterized protein n=1 Tax=Oryza meridionalis TaxID=40149 RepID=A0A0E0EBC3_9ORYZ